MKTTPKTALLLYALIWLGAGCMLLYKGIFLLLGAEEHLLLVHAAMTFLPAREDVALLLIAAGLTIGVLKAKMVLKKVAARARTAVQSAQNPLQAVFSLRTVILVAVMMSFGLILKAIQTPSDILGLIDVAVGSALIQGAVFIKQPLPQTEPCASQEIPS